MTCARSITLCAAALAATVTLAAPAENHQFVQPGDADWNFTLAWSPWGIPGQGDLAIFSSFYPGTRRIFNSSPVNVSNIRLDHPGGIIRFDPGFIGQPFHCDDLKMGYDDFHAPILSIVGGTFTTNTAQLGYLGGIASVFVEDHGTWEVDTVTASPYPNSYGYIFVRNHGTLDAGQIRMSDDSDTHSAIHVESHGLLRTDDLIIGFRPNVAEAEVIIKNNGTMDAGLVRVGTHGHGDLVVEAGGYASIDNFQVGSHWGWVSSTGTAIVRGSVDASTLRVGLGGDGEVIVENGGALTADSAQLGDGSYDDASNGNVIVRGAGSTWTVAGTITLGKETSGLDSVGWVRVENGGAIEADRISAVYGNLALAEGGTLTANTLVFPSQFAVSGGTLHAGSTSEHLRNDSGRVAPNGTTTVNGTYTQDAGGTTEIELLGTGGVPGTDFDRITATLLSLDGTLEIIAGPDYTPTIGESFTILTGTRYGSFADVVTPSIEGVEFAVAYTAEAVRINVNEATGGDPDPCPADVTDDLMVDVADLLAVLSAWGACDECSADTNDDGVVDVTDLLAVLSNWGSCF